MATKKLLARLGEFLQADHGSQKKEIAAIGKVLKKLKEKEKELREKLEREDDPAERAELATRLEVIAVQRRKGRDRVRELKDE